jgi:serine/threonine protein kinase
MELLEGQTVKEKIEGQGMPAEQVLDLVIQIAHGLDAAHGKGVVHRDIKPTNLFVTGTGQLKILDFGIAKLVVIPGNTAASTSAPTVADQADLTSEGVTVGTIAYMSPIAAGQDIVGRVSG